MSPSKEIRAIICGCINRETIINLENKIMLDRPGGSLLYSAAGFCLWSENPGLVARVSNDMPDHYFNQLSQRRMNSIGININSFKHEMRAFYKIIDQDNYVTENPISYFGLLKKEFPKHLLGYTSLPFLNEKRNTTSPLTILPEHIPGSFLDCVSALLCSVDFISLSTLAPFLRMSGIKNLIIKPSSASMVSNFWNEMPVLVRGSTGLICTRNEAFRLFLGKSENLDELIETMASFGLEFVIITCGKDGQYLYTKANKTHWNIPAYPSKIIDCVHASDAFAGGFLAGFLKYFDPLTACYYGNVAASFKIEGSGAFYLLDALPELANARLEILKENTKKI